MLLFYFWRIQIISEGSWELSDSSLRISVSLLEVSSSRPTPQACMQQCPFFLTSPATQGQCSYCRCLHSFTVSRRDVHILPQPYLEWRELCLKLLLGSCFSVPREGRSCCCDTEENRGGRATAQDEQVPGISALHFQAFLPVD